MELINILPIEMEFGDDRIETPQGVTPVTSGENPITAGLSTQWPPLLGYQRFTPRAGSTVVASFADDPFIVTGEYGRGRTLAYASDIGEHWAPQEFTAWDDFGPVWPLSVNMV